MIALCEMFMGINHMQKRWNDETGFFFKEKKKFNHMISKHFDERSNALLHTVSLYRNGKYEGNRKKQTIFSL